MRSGRVAPAVGAASRGRVIRYVEGVIFTPFRLASGLTLRNRLLVAPMTTYSSYEDGTIREDELDYLERRARGGFGAITTAACYVHPTGHAFDGQWGCESDQRLDSLVSARRAIQRGGAAAILQIHHGGRQCPGRHCGGRPVAPSEVAAERPNAELPRALDAAEVEQMVEAFGRAAHLAKKAGYDGVEIHGANTYLIQQFVSPHSNRRMDDWCDPLRFPLAVTDAVLAATGPGFSVGYRFSPEESETPGIRLDLTFQLLDALVTRPLDYLHISLGDYRQPSLHDPDGPPVIGRVLAHLRGRMPLIGVGSVLSAEDAEAVLQTGADLVAIGRAAVSEPEWPQVALVGGAPRWAIPSEGAAETLTIPAGLERKIYAVPGWFDVEPVGSSH
jgi:2,4-dienoyl-CoA reductase-like NADH-dependent reductase (Old Yellow Enzyme family)